MLNGFTIVSKTAPAKFGGVPAVWLITFYAHLTHQRDTVAGTIKNLMLARGWRVEAVNAYDASYDNTQFGGLFQAVVLGNSSDTNLAIEGSFARQMNDVGIAVNFVQAGIVQTVDVPTGNNGTPTGTPINQTGNPPPTQPKEDSSFDKFFRQIGEALKLDAKSAVVGGAVVSIAVIAILMKK